MTSIGMLPDLDIFDKDGPCYFGSTSKDDYMRFVLAVSLESMGYYRLIICYVGGYYHYKACPCTMTNDGEFYQC